MRTEILEVAVTAVRQEAERIKSYELSPIGDARLPSFEAGAHIDILLPNGLARSYSLINPGDARNRYVVAVLNDAASRGGSSYLHEHVEAGSTLNIHPPRNTFELDESAPHSVMIAGGIGITPVWAMIQRLDAIGAPWTLHYSARTSKAAAFLAPLSEIEACVPGRVHFNFDHEPGGRMLDLKALVKAAPAGAHFYCCGPNPMIASFMEATANIEPHRVHREYFASVAQPAVSGGFTVKLAKSGRSIFVPAGKTILDALLDERIDAPFSCMEGTCGTCETRVLEGVPDHRDAILSEQEKIQSKSMMICCSGSKSETLVLDL